MLSPAGIATLLEPSADATVGPWAKDPGVTYGMGWYIGGGPFGPREAAFHPGGSPGFSTMVILLPRESAGVVVLMNATPGVGLAGAAGALDTISAGAASLLMDSQPKGGWRVLSLSVPGLALVITVVGMLLVALASLTAHESFEQGRPKHASPPSSPTMEMK